MSIIARRIIKQLTDINKLLNWIDGCACKIIESGKEVEVSIVAVDPIKIDQMKKINAMIHDIHRQAEIKILNNKIKLSSRPIDEIKTLLVFWYAEEKETQGEPLKHGIRTIYDFFTMREIAVRPSTKDFDVSEASDCIEWLYALGADLKIKWTEPKLKQIQQYPEAQYE